MQESTSAVDDVVILASPQYPTRPAAVSHRLRRRQRRRARSVRRSRERP
ncbi:hypothetical protein HMPREF0972_01451 [Actinomyces sp. oral taxon 848 str. F0332]|nr:hypothetical protein HMPREF0972_01451 [Actinomyces sp. oral taxon 848 str. F0332]